MNLLNITGEVVAISKYQWDGLVELFPCDGTEGEGKFRINVKMSGFIRIEFGIVAHVSATSIDRA